MLECGYFILKTALLAQKVEILLLFCINHHIFLVNIMHQCNRIFPLSTRKTRFLKCLGKSDLFATFNDKLLT